MNHKKIYIVFSRWYELFVLYVFLTKNLCIPLRERLSIKFILKKKKKKEEERSPTDVSVLVTYT